MTNVTRREASRKEDFAHQAEQAVVDYVERKEALGQQIAIEEALLASADKRKTGLEQAIQRPLNAWFRFFVTYDPRPALRKVSVPVLVLNGGLDAQVDPAQNLPEIEKALKAGGNSDVTVKELPKLNHLFQTAETGAFSEYATIEETMSPVMLRIVSEWILKRFG